MCNMAVILHLGPRKTHTHRSPPPWSLPCSPASSSRQWVGLPWPSSARARQELPGPASPRTSAGLRGETRTRARPEAPLRTRAKALRSRPGKALARPRPSQPEPQRCLLPLSLRRKLRHSQRRPQRQPASCTVLPICGPVLKYGLHLRFWFLLSVFSSLRR